jgi:hypothetical protein
MEESTTFQEIKRPGREEGRQEGRAREAQELLLRLGCKRVGEPRAAMAAQIGALRDLDRLHTLLGRQTEVETWDELFARHATAVSAAYLQPALHHPIMRFASFPHPPRPAG